MGNGLSWEDIQEAMASVLEKQSFEALWALGVNLTIAFFIGGAILTAIMTPITYIMVKKFVEERQARRSGKQK